MRGHNDPERGVLPLRELWEHERVFVGGVKNSEMEKMRYMTRHVI
jgi:hypothetical protein